MLCFNHSWALVLELIRLWRYVPYVLAESNKVGWTKDAAWALILSFPAVLCFLIIIIIYTHTHTPLNARKTDVCHRGWCVSLCIFIISWWCYSAAYHFDSIMLIREVWAHQPTKPSIKWKSPLVGLLFFSSCLPNGSVALTAHAH